MQRSTATWHSVVVVLALVVSACGGSSASEPATSEPAASEPGASGSTETDGLFPDVVEAVARQADDGTWTFDVTLSSPYDSADRYADAWRVLGPDGEQLGIRELAHDHASEQPFTRSLDGVVIPDGTTEVTIEGRDQINGWGGTTKTISLKV